MEKKLALTWTFPWQINNRKLSSSKKAKIGFQFIFECWRWFHWKVKLKTKVAGFECQRRGFPLLPGTGASSDSRKEWSVTLGGCAATVVGTMPNMPGIRDRIQPAEIFMDAAGLEIKPNSYSQCLKTSPKVSLDMCPACAYENCNNILTIQLR